jgi:hypothetical protein
VTETERNVSVGDSPTATAASEAEDYFNEYQEEEPTPPSAESSPSSSSDKQNDSNYTINATGTTGAHAGRDIGTITQLIINMMKSEGIDLDERKPLVDFTSELGPSRSVEANLDAALIEKYSEELRAERLILISSANDHLALDSAHSIVARLELANLSQRRLLDLKRASREKISPSLDFLRRADQAREVWAIVIDAVSEASQTFLDDLLNRTGPGLAALRFELEQSKLFLIVIVNNDDIRSRLVYQDSSGPSERECPFLHWHIPFLIPLLLKHFSAEYEELHARIMALRDRWDPDDRKFRLRIEALIRNGKLQAVIAAAAQSDEFIRPELLFNGDSSLRDHVLFVGTHFSGLNPREFQRIVELLIQDRTITVSVPSTVRLEDGGVEKVELEKEKLLVDVWHESMDKTQRECFLVASPAEDSRTIIEFKDHRIQQLLKDHLALEYPAFSSTQSERLLNLGLLFDQSYRISESMTQLTAEMIVSDPEYYGHELIGQMLARVEEGNEALPAGQPLFPSLAGIDRKKVNPLIYTRLGQLIRRLLEHHKATEITNELLEQLIRQRLFHSVFELVKRLRFVPQFDEFYWFRQLIERGDRIMAKRIFLYLYIYLRNTGSNIYSVLEALDAWIKKDPPAGTYSKAANEALKLIFSYCFAAELQQTRPSFGNPHSLFAFPDATSANRSFSLLMRNLFHPWMGRAVTDLNPEIIVIQSVSELIADWVTAILRNTTGSITASQPESTSGLSPNETVRILLQQVVAYANDEQQKALINLWRQTSAQLLEQITVLPYVSNDRKEMILRRNRIEDLTTQFRRMSKTH